MPAEDDEDDEVEDDCVVDDEVKGGIFEDVEAEVEVNAATVEVRRMVEDVVVVDLIFEDDEDVVSLLAENVVETVDSVVVDEKKKLAESL